MPEVKLLEFFLQRFNNPDGPVFYWLRVLWDSLHQVYTYVWGPRWVPVAIAAVVIFIASVLIYHRLWGRFGKGRLTPLTSGVAGLLRVAIFVFALVLLNNAFSLYDEQRMRAELSDYEVEPDTPEQMEARRKLAEFYAEHLLPSHPKLIAYADRVHNSIAGESSLSIQLDQDTSTVLAELMGEYRRTEIGEAHKSILDVIDGREEVSFGELMDRTERYYRAYADLAELTQRTALKARMSISSDPAYMEWNEVDETFLSNLPVVLTHRELAGLRSRISEYRVERGPWDVFRIRSIEVHD